MLCSGLSRDSVYTDLLLKVPLVNAVGLMFMQQVKEGIKLGGLTSKSSLHLGHKSLQV